MCLFCYNGAKGLKNLIYVGTPKDFDADNSLNAWVCNKYYFKKEMKDLLLKNKKTMFEVQDGHL